MRVLLSEDEVTIAVTLGDALTAAGHEVLAAADTASALRVLEEKSREECASELGVTLGNLDVLVHRALAALRARMTPVPDG